MGLPFAWYRQWRYPCLFLQIIIEGDSKLKENLNTTDIDTDSEPFVHLWGVADNGLVENRVDLKYTIECTISGLCHGDFLCDIRHFHFGNERSPSSTHFRLSTFAKVTGNRMMSTGIALKAKCSDTNSGNGMTYFMVAASESAVIYYSLDRRWPSAKMRYLNTSNESRVSSTGLRRSSQFHKRMHPS